MVNCTVLTEHTGCFDRIAAHPEQVGGVQIHAHHGANGLPQTEQGLRVVYQLHPVVFQRDLTDAAVLRHADQFLPLLKKRLAEKEVEVRADEAARAVVPEFTPATEEDWGTEYLDYILSLKIVDSVEEAIEHINKYNTGHSESIITSDYFNAQKFLDEVDAAAVYVNASTRFTDGEEFGFGAEIGISTQKLHARGPMGLKELTTTKYIIYGDGQIR